VIVSNPGLYSWYPSIGPERWNGSFEGCGRKYIWCVELGYPNIDVQQWKDGEQAIIEFYNSPNIPSLTRWNFVLTGLRNIEITPGFLTRYIHQLDLHRKEVWEAAEAKSREADERHATLEKHAEDTANAAFKVLRGNDDLMQRVAKNGISEIDPNKIRSNIPRHQLIGHKVRV
jgi:hypothetical protein